MPWVVTKKEDHSFDADLKDPEADGVWRDAWVKWDGCVQYGRYANWPKGLKDRNTECDDNVHICSVAETVGELVDLLKLAAATLPDGEWEAEALQLERVLSERGWIKRP